MGDTQGAAHVTVKLLELIVAADMSSEKTAEMVWLMSAPGVGPGSVVAGTVRITVGAVVSDVAPVVNVQT